MPTPRMQTIKYHTGAATMGDGWTDNDAVNEYFAEMLTAWLESEFPDAEVEVVTHDGTGPTNAIEVTDDGDSDPSIAVGLVQGIAEKCFDNLCSDPPARFIL
jgi:hypothetical protein